MAGSANIWERGQIGVPGTVIGSPTAAEITSDIEARV
jgi:hypothetical protein